MQELPKSEVFDIPGVGELPARAGTSTYELAGAVSVWHKKYLQAHKTGRIDGLIGGVLYTLLIESLIAGVYFYLRN